MASSSSSSAGPPNRQWKHSVFLSFSGEDVRSNLISHLYKALSEISSEVFIDYRLKPAEEIGPALIKAIEDSRIAVIIFSRRYASSTWCLDELENIIECNKNPGQLDVIPVFYHVDASHVHNPTIEGGIYAQDFARHQKSFKDKLEKVESLRKAIKKMPNRLAHAFFSKLPLVFILYALGWHEKDMWKKLKQVQRWKNAMIKAANFKGWDSQSKEIRSDAELVDRVVKHVLEKLIQMSPSNLKGLVGMDSRIEEIKELLFLKSNEVLLLGIWGMGGIGKTTIAKALFQQIRHKFEASCMLENIRQESEKAGGLSRLREELLSEIIGRKYMVSNIIHSYHLKDILSRRKVLVILDDLTDLMQLEDLIGDTSWLGPGSRIIITSRDKDIVGKACILGESVYVIDPFEVEELTYAESFKLFSLNAFERKHPTKDFWQITTKFVKYARGVPLALKVLGRHLLGKNKERWEHSLSNLKKGPLPRIQNVLKLSYDDLSPDGQDMFLDVACFLSGENFRIVEQIFERCDYSIEIYDLIDKCLVTKSNNNDVSIHPLLEEMGKEIERRKSKDPSKRTRLWDHKAICGVFKSKIVSESIESITLDMSKTTEVLQLDPHAFTRTPNLKLLRFHSSNGNNGQKVNLPDGLEDLPDKLLFVYWYEYPLKYLPVNFNPTELVLLNLPHSSLEQLWEHKKELEIRSQLQVPASNLTGIIIDHATMFDKFSKICDLNLSYCKNMTSLPSLIELEFLQRLNLCGCTQLLEFPEVPRNIEFLYLEETRIEQVPMSVSYLDNLKYLDLKQCPNLKDIPFQIFMGKSSYYLSVNDSPNVHINTLSETSNDCLPYDLNSSSIYQVDVSQTDIESLPDRFRQLFGLEELNMNFCKNLRSLPELPPNLRTIHAENCTSLEAVSGLKQLLDIQVIDLIASQDLFFPNCLNVDEKNWCNLIPDMILRIQNMAKKAKEYELIVEPYFRIIYAGSKIPESFACSNEGSSSVTIELPPNWYTSKFLGFILCAVVVDEDIDFDEAYYFGIHCELEFQNNKGATKTVMCCFGAQNLYTQLSSEHVTLWYDYNLCVKMARLSDWFCPSSSYKVSFKFVGTYGYSDGVVVKRCGVLLICDQQDDKESNGGEAAPSKRKNRVKKGSKYWRPKSEYCNEDCTGQDRSLEMVSTDHITASAELMEHHQLQQSMTAGY